jgi:hypothetical protein
MRVSPRTLIVVLAALVLLALPSFATFYTDWLWFVETGYQRVFARSLTAQATTGLVTGLVAFVLLALNARLALAFLSQPYLVIGASQGGRPIVLDRRQIRRLTTIGALLVSILIGLSISTSWLQMLEYLNATPFGVADPILGRDVSFYVFTLPVYDLVRSTLIVLVVLSLIASAGLYAFSGGVSFEVRLGFTTSPRARQHLSLLIAALFLLMAAGAWLDIPRQLLVPSSFIQGASYVDVYARLPVLRLSVVVLVIGAALAAYHAFTSRLWPVVTAFALYLAVWLGGAVYAEAIQRFVVAPNEQSKELPYIVYNIEATRKAFNLDQVEERQLTGDAELTLEDIKRNADTLDNVRLWDHQPLLDTFGQIQEIRTYYDFVSVDNDRYTIDGRYRQIMLSVRELNSESLPNRTWVNERLTFTHGYGLTLGPVNQVTSEGLPVLFIKDLPPVSAVNLEMKEPSVYFGELSNSYVLVRTQAKEFHYPKGDDNVYSTYDGRGGVPIGTFWRRLLFAIRFGSTDIVLTEQATPESRILFHRRLSERIREIAPFLTYDSDPYPVIANERLFWIQDAYTITGNYPYSSRASGGVNYIRNAVKVVVDAYHGDTTFYLADPKDPIALTLGRIFPGLLKSIDQMPEDLRAHLRYPEDIFTLQTAMYSTYHMTNPAVFYNKEDQWEVPTIDGEGRPAQMRPYYTIMRLPGERDAEFIQMLPFTPRRKDNLAAWMVARSDGEHYGKLFVFPFPKQKVVYGPRQIVARVNQDQVISPQITLWNQQGSEVIQGTLLVVPIEESLIYIRPLYLRASGGRIPELKRVIVAYQNQIVMEETLQRALDRIFIEGAGALAPGATPPEAAPAAAPGAPAAEPQAPVSVEPAGGESLETLATLANEHYARAIQAQRDGNWTLYGEEIKKLGEILERMGKRR